MLSEQQNCFGFTLLEVLFSLIILSLTLTAIFHLFSTGLAAEAATRDYENATVLSHNLLANVGIDIPLEVGEYKETSQDKFRWHMTIKEWPGYDQNTENNIAWFDFYKVQVDIKWNDGRQLSISTLKGRDKKQ